MYKIASKTRQLSRPLCGKILPSHVACPSRAFHFFLDARFKRRSIPAASETRVLNRRLRRHRRYTTAIAVVRCPAASLDVEE